MQYQREDGGRGSSLGAVKFALRRKSVLRQCWKARVRLPPQPASPGPVAEGFEHRVFPSKSGRGIPETSSELPLWSRPTFRWAFRRRSRLSRAPAGSRKYGRKSALFVRARGVETSWKLSCCATFCARPKRWTSLEWSSAPSQNRKTHPAPLRGAATKPGVLRSEV